MAEKKRRGTSEGMMVDRPEKVERPKPSFSVNEHDLPEIKNWSVGKKYKLSIEVEMRSHSKGDSYGFDEREKKTHEARLVITSVKPAEKE